MYPDMKFTCKTVVGSASVIGVYYQSWLQVLGRMCTRTYFILLKAMCEHLSFERSL
jgi:hypothetical protein